MKLFGWLRRRTQRQTCDGCSTGSSKDAAIAARVDMVRFEALAEASYDALYEARQKGDGQRFDEARRCFDSAIDAAKRANLTQEAARLTRRRDQVVRIYQGQFRYSSGG